MSATRTDPPPYADEGQARPGPPPPTINPPSHDDVICSRPRDQLATNELVCLILDGYLVYAENQPERPLYELTNSPINTKLALFAVEKVTYQLSTNDGEGVVQQRKRHIYDVRAGITTSFGEVVALEAKASSKLAFKNVTMSQPVPLSWSSCKVEGHFQAKRNLKKRFGRSDQLDWKDKGDNLVAVETKSTRGKRGLVDIPPRIEIRARLDTKTFDLLVTSWLARMWAEAQKDLKEPFSWSKFKRIASAKRTGASGNRTGASAAVSAAASSGAFL